MDTLRMTAGQTPAEMIFVRLHPGEEVHACLMDLARREAVPSASVSGLGAVNDIVLALFDPASRRYLETRLTEDLEVVSLAGNLAWAGDDPVIHLHGVVSRADCSTAAGHIMRATVSVTLEIALMVGSRRMERRLDPAFSLKLLHLR